MATLSNPVYYIAGEIDTTYRAVGMFSSTDMAIVRYTLTMDADESASQLRIDMDSGNYTQWRDYNSTVWQDIKNENVFLNFYVGTDPDEFAGVTSISSSISTGRVLMKYRSGYGVEENLTWDMILASLDSTISSGTIEPADVLLLPNTTYYIWIFPAYTSYGCFKWYDNGEGRFTYTVTTSGSAGLVYIDNGTSFDAYQCYIDNGTSWDLYVPYIDNGTSFEICS